MTNNREDDGNFKKTLMDPIALLQDDCERPLRKFVHVVEH